MPRLSFLLLLTGCGPHIAGWDAPPEYPTDALIYADEALSDPSRWRIVDVRASWDDGAVPDSVALQVGSLLGDVDPEHPDIAARRVRDALPQTWDADWLILGDTAEEWAGKPGQAYWALRLAGVSSPSVLEGGTHAWRRAGGAWSDSAEPVHIDRASSAPIRPDLAATTADVQAHLARGGLLLDVRTQEEWRNGHIPGATWWPIEQARTPDARAADPQALLESLAQAGLHTLDQPVVTTCTRGYRSADAFWVLEALGVTHSSNYTGSIEGWQAAGLPLQTEE